ncbi:MAG: rhodanese-like domain-containing protein [Candidatus Gracilibacteria bacterium]|nr:rhodanese-like domain-containing protein [Candidatus Gracilibacteria bacterium]
MKLKFLLLFFLLFFLLVSCSKDENENKVAEKDIQVTDKQIQLAKQELLGETNINSVVFKRLALNDFKKELQKEDSILIDLRTIGELEETGIIPGAKQIDFYSSDFKSYLNSLDKSNKYLIYCRSGNRSSQTLSLMEELGFKKVLELEGGINNWISSGETITKFSSNNN